MSYESELERVKNISARSSKKDKQETYTNEEYETALNRVKGIKAKRDKADYSYVDDTYISNFFYDSDKYFKNHSTSTQDLGYSNTLKVANQSKKDFNSIYERAKNIRGYLLSQDIDDENVRSMLDTVQSIIDNGLEGVSSLNRLANYYGNFKSEEDYNNQTNNWTQATMSAKDRKANGFTEEGGFAFDMSDAAVKYRQDKYNSNLNRIAEIDNELKKWDFSKGIYSQGNSMVTSDRQALKDERKKLEKENRLYERGGQFDADKTAYLTQTLSQNDDFERQSQNRKFDNASREDIINASSKWYERADEYGNVAPVGNEAVIEDKYGLWKNATDEERAQVRQLTDEWAGYSSEVGADTDKSKAYDDFTGNEWDKTIRQGDENNWEQMTESEENVYYYLLNTQGQKSAYDYLDSLGDELNHRARQSYEKQFSEDWDERSVLEKIAMSVASVPTQVLGGAARGAGAVAGFLTGETNPYAEGEFNQFAELVRQNTAEDIDNALGGKSFLGMTGGDAYQSVMSFADSTFGRLFKAGYEPMMGLSALASTAQDLYEDGASDGQVIALSVLSGVAEAVFEHVSLEKLKQLQPKEGGSFIVNLLKQAFTEGSEEVATDMANRINDIIIRGDESDIMQTYYDAINNGASESEASMTAFKEAMLSDWKSFAGGAISGGLGAGLQTTVINNYSNVGKGVQQNGALDNLRGMAQSMAEGTDVNGEVFNVTDKQKQRLSDLLEKTGGEKVSDADIGKLYGVTMDIIEAQNKADISNALSEQGVKGIGKAVAQNDFNKYANEVNDTLGITTLNKRAGLASDIVNDSESTINKRKAYLHSLGLDVVTRVDEQGNHQGYENFGYDLGGIRNDIAEQISPANISDKLNAQNKAKEQLRKDYFEGKRGQRIELNLTEDQKNELKTLSDNESKINSRQNYSEDGFAYDKTGKKIDIKNVAESKNGVLTYNLHNGEQISSKDVVYGNKDDMMFYEYLAEQGFSANDINYFRILAEDSQMGMQKFLLGLREAYTDAYIGLDYKAKGESYYALPSNVRSTIEKYAKENKQETLSKKNTEQQKRMFSEKQVHYDGNATVKVDKAVQMLMNKENKNSDKYKKAEASTKALEVVAHYLGANIEVVPDIHGAYGSYNATTNTIKVSVKAGGIDNRTIMQTVGHELTHYLRNWNAEGFNDLGRILVENYGQGDLDARIAHQQNLARKYGDAMNVDDAFEEVVAQAMQRFLLDSNAIETWQAMMDKNAEGTKSLLDHIKKIVSDLRTLLDGNYGTGDEALMVSQIEGLTDKLNTAMLKGLEVARQNSMQTTVNENITELGDGGIQLQMAQYDESGREALRTYMTEHYGVDSANELVDTVDSIYDAVSALKDEGVSEIFGNWQEQSVEYDKDGHPIFTTSIKNGEYVLNQDFSRVCKKRRQLDFVLNELCKDENFDATKLTKDDFVKINQAIKDRGFEIACALCFVDAKRFRQAQWAESFSNVYNDILASVTGKQKLTPFNFATANPNVKDEGITIDLNAPVTFKKYGTKNDEFVVDSVKTYKNLNDLIKNEGNANIVTMAKQIRDNPQARHSFRSADIIASQGFDSIQRLNPTLRGVLDGWGGSSVPKPSSSDTIYDNSILNIDKYNAKTAFAVGGVRMNSFSDYMSHMFFDYVQAFADLTAKGLPMQAYTKELDMVRLFGLTGGKINMSLIAKIRDGALSLDGLKDTQKEYKRRMAIEKRVAGLNVDRLCKELGKTVEELTDSDVSEHLDLVDYLWADESIDYTNAVLMQSGIMYDKLTEQQKARCLDAIRKGQFEKAFKIAGEKNVNRDYAKNIGTIAVGVSDAHILKLLRDDTIRMVIPYHKSGLNAIVAKALNIAYYNDYSSYQNTGLLIGGNRISMLGKSAADKGYNLKDFNFYDYFGKTVDGKFYDAKATAQKYIDWCKNGTWDESVGDYVYYLNGKDGGYMLASELHQTAQVVPKFEQFAEETNYYKLLEDFDCYNTIDDTHSQQEAVQMVLPDDYKDVLREGIKAEQDVKDRFVDELDHKGLRDDINAIVNKTAPSVVDMARGIKNQAIDDIDNKQEKRYNKHTTYSQAETEFMKWANGSSTVGKVRMFIRRIKGKNVVKFYEKTSDYCVEISRQQYVERGGYDATNVDRKAERRFSVSNDINGGSERTEIGYNNGNRISSNAVRLSNATLGETLRNGTGRSVRSDDGNGNRISKITNEASSNEDAFSMPENEKFQLEDLNKEHPQAKWGLNFHDKTGRHIDKIFAQINPKVYETRAENAPLDKSVINTWSGIVQTGDGKAKLVGYWKLGVGQLRDSAWLKAHASELGNDGTDYEAVEGESKWVYRILTAERIDAPREVNNKGIRKRDISVKHQYVDETTDEGIRYQYSDKDSDGNTLSEGQQEFFKDSKVRDKNGNLLVMYHGTVSDFTEFDKSEINKYDTDFYVNGFWFSDDENTSPAFRDAKRTLKGYLNITNPAPIQVVKSVKKEVFAETDESKWHKESRSSQDEIRYRLQDMGYDGIHFDGKPTYDSTELERTGQVVVTFPRGYQQVLVKNEDGYLDLYDWHKSDGGWYDEYENITGYTDMEDFLSMQEEVYIAFESNQFKNADNLNPTESKDIRYQREDSRGNGYDGYSMSNNARDAYDNGEMPLSKWSKSEIINAVSVINPSIAEKLKAVKLDSLRHHLLKYTSWHHTSSMYNQTDFYSIDEDVLEGLTDDTIDEWARETKAKPVTKKYRGDIDYIEWTGTRNHPKANPKSLSNVNIEERGSFYIVTDDNGSEILRKKIGSNGTSVTNYIERDARIAEKIAKENAYHNNSSNDAIEFYDGMKGREYSTSGHIYEQGRKPSRIDYDNGLENFFSVGEHRLYDDFRNKKYILQTWNGNEWESEKYQREDLGYHAGDLGKSEWLGQQGRSRDTGHFGTGTYFVGDKAEVTEDSYYGKRPQHAVDFSQYNLFKVGTDKRGYDLHNALREIDGGVNAEWIKLAKNMEYNAVSTTEYYDIANEKFGKEWFKDANIVSAIKESAKRHNIELPTDEDFMKQSGFTSPSEEDYDAYRADFYKDAYKKAFDEVNNEYGRFRDAYSKLLSTFGYHENDILKALNAVVEYENTTAGDAKADSYATVFMKAMGYDGVDVRGTALDNTTYGSVIYDLNEDSVVYQRADKVTDNRTLLANALTSATKTADERRLLNEYKKSIQIINNADKMLTQYRKQLKSKDISTAEKSQIRAKIEKAQKLVSAEDSKLLKLTAQKPIKDIINRERKLAIEQNTKQIKAESREVAKNASIRREASQTRNHLKANLNQLHDMLTKPSKGRYVPVEMRKYVAGILAAIDTDSGRSENLTLQIAGLKAQYDAMAKDERYSIYYNEVLADMLQTVSNSFSENVYDMTKGKRGQELQISTEKLALLDKMVSALKHYVTNAVKVRGIETEKTAFEVAAEMMSETRSVQGRKDTLIDKYVQMGLRSQTMFNRLGGYTKNSMWSQVYRMLDNGQLKQTQLTMEGQQMFAELFKDEKSLRKLVSVKELVDIGLKDDNGRPIMITRDMMLAIRMALMNEDNARHISMGGYTIPDMQMYSKGDKDAWGTRSVRAKGYAEDIAEINRQISEAEEELRNTTDAERQAELEERLDYLDDRKEQAYSDATTYAGNIARAIDKIIVEDGELGKYEMRFMEIARNFFDGWSKDNLNKTTMEEYGFEKATVDYYFPIHTDKNFTNRTFDQITKDMSLENSGFMKERVKASNPIMLEGLSDVVNAQIKNVARYCGLMPAISQFNRIYNKTASGYADSIPNAVNAKFGNAGKMYIENLIADLTGARMSQSTMFDKARGMMAGAVLTLNPRVALAQAASYPTAAAILGYGPLAKALAHGGKNNTIISRADQELIAKYSPLLWYRMQGYSTTELGDAKTLNQAQKKIGDKMKWLTGWINAFDGATVGRLWYASEYYVQDNFKALQKGTEQYYEKVAEIFNRVVEETQPDYTTMQRPDVLRNPNAIVKQLTMFMTQRLQNFNIVYDAVGQYKKYASDYKYNRNGVTSADVAEAKHTLCKSISSQMVSAVTIVMMKTLTDFLMHNVGSYRDDDEELTAKSTALAMIDQLLDTIIGNVVGGTELYSVLSSMLSGERYYGISMSGVDTYSDIIENAVSTTQDFSKDNVWKLAKSVAQMFGLPLNNASKFVSMFKNWGTDIAQGEAFSYNATKKQVSNTNKAKSYAKAITSGDKAKASKLYEEMLENSKQKLQENRKADGKTELSEEDLLKKAKSSVKSSITSIYKEEYVTAYKRKNNEKMAEIRKALFATGLYGSVDDIIKTCNGWVEDYVVK